MIKAKQKLYDYLINYIEEMEMKQYEARTIVDSVKNYLKFNRYL